MTLIFSGRNNGLREQIHARFRGVFDRLGVLEERLGGRLAVVDDLAALAAALWTRQGNTDAVLAGVLRAGGAAGSQILTGAGAPSNGSGSDGDFYLRTSNGDYYKKAAGSWGSVLGSLVGPSGAAGSQLLTGSDVPSTGGANGDFYLRSNGDYYQKSGGTWGSVLGSLKGGQGIQGIPGPAAGYSTTRLDSNGQTVVAGQVWVVNSGLNLNVSLADGDTAYVHFFGDVTFAASSNNYQDVRTGSGGGTLALTGGGMVVLVRDNNGNRIYYTRLA